MSIQEAEDTYRANVEATAWACLEAAVDEVDETIARHKAELPSPAPLCRVIRRRGVPRRGSPRWWAAVVLALSLSLVGCDVVTAPGCDNIRCWPGQVCREATCLDEASGADGSAHLFHPEHDTALCGEHRAPEALPEARCPRCWAK